jgi:protein TonB
MLVMAAAHFLPAALRDTPARRLSLACAVSAALHWAVAAMPGSESPHPLQPARRPAFLSVELDTATSNDGDKTARKAAEPVLPPTPERAVLLHDGSARREPARAGVRDQHRKTDAQPSLPQVPDPVVYPARELDRYPTPAAPFELDALASRLGGVAAVTLRLELLIDEQGRVGEAAILDPGPLEWVALEARAIVAATRFHPARKDGRAVKSRVTLSVDLVREWRER